MLHRLKLAITFLALTAIVVPGTLHAQEMGRFRVLIPNFEPLEGANKKFGEKAAEELRDLINTLATHQPIEKKEIEQNLKRFKMKMEELDCIRTRQLASQIDAQVALCASFSEQGDQRTVNATFWDVASSEKFDVGQTEVGKDDQQIAAQYIFDQFDRYVQQIRAQGICVDYAQSQQWENALRNCDQALELNPDAIGTRYQRARILYEMENYPDALEELERVLALDGFHEDALQLAGYISAKEGLDDQARTYYSNYLELNPANAAVRMKIAYDLAQAGDPVGGMQLIQVGLDVDPENVDLWEQYGGFAFAAALEAVQEASLGAENGGGVPPEAVELYREAIGAYEKVFAVKGSETRVQHLRNILAAYIQLEELDKAVEVGSRILDAHPQEDALWSIYADALQRSGQLDEAIAALDRVKEINPSHPSASLRQGNWLIEAGHIDRAVDVLSEVAASNPEQADQAARLIFVDAYQNGYQAKAYAKAISGFSAAKKLPGISQELTHQLNFWHAFSLYQSSVQAQEAQTLETAQATLPRFQEALRLFGQVGDYPASVNVNLQQLLDNTNTYVEIQEAIIKRGR